MIPPIATARTTAREVQLRGVPVPIQRSGWEVSTARASRGTGTAAAGAVSAPVRVTQSVARTSCRRIGDLRVVEPSDRDTSGLPVDPARLERERRASAMIA